MQLVISNGGFIVKMLFCYLLVAFKAPIDFILSLAIGLATIGFWGCGIISFFVDDGQLKFVFFALVYLFGLVVLGLIRGLLGDLSVSVGSNNM
ncbi:hypothetical protein [Desulfotalea psychrophila]|uniref:hypothetical protein n=1 Tax=Desulfotalea psychrophila TaxID=84980 RepID=UPI00059E49FC|nr:hypothetical protein [Desulfotalea psychrophila]